MTRTFWVWMIFVGSGAATGLGAADVALDAVLKIQHFQQPTSGAPAIPPTNGYSFQAFVVASTNNTVTGAVVRLPNATTKTLVVESSRDLRFEERFNTSAAMDAVYSHSFGKTYQMQMQTVNDGPHANNCGYLIASYPTTAQVQNWTAAQQIDHTRSFTLQWNALGGSASDVVQVLVYQNATNLVYSSPFPFTSNALNGTSTAVTIPGYKLPPGTNLTGQVIVIQVAGLPDTSYATGVALMGKDTTFPMQTRAAPSAPVLTLVSRTNGQTQLLLSGETNRTYQIQATDDWVDWQTLLTTNATAGSVFFNDAQATNYAVRSYRGRVGD